MDLFLVAQNAIGFLNVCHIILIDTSIQIGSRIRGLKFYGLIDILDEASFVSVL